MFVNHGPGRICRYNPDTRQVNTIVQLIQQFDPPDIAVAAQKVGEILKFEAFDRKYHS